MPSAPADIEDVQPRQSRAAPDWNALLGLLQGGAGGAAPQGGEAAAQLQASLDELATENPAMAALLHMVQRRESPAAETPAPEPDLPDPDCLTLGPQERADLQQLLVQTRAMEQELHTLRTRNDTLAAALGACYLCFGEDPSCMACRGQGRPGSWRPAPEAFKRYVAPVLRRVRTETAAGTRPPPSPSPAPAGATSQFPSDHQKGRPVP